MPSLSRQPLEPQQKRVLALFLVTGLLVLTFLGLWVFLKTSTGVHLAAGRQHDPAHLRALVTRGALLSAFLGLAAICFADWARTRALIHDFFFTPTHPLNLAVFRLVVFGAIFLRASSPDITALLDLPVELQFPPATGLPDWGPLAAVAHWPVFSLAAETVRHLLLALQIASLLAFFGVFTRLSSVATAVLAVMVLGIPYWYGTVGHSYHYILWVTLLLAASRPGDAFSVDALVAAWRRADRGETAGPGPAPVYRLPLSFAMILMALTYFWPGVWKAWDHGLDWALSDNFQWTLYGKWFDTGGWLPMVRLDRFPLLLKLGALAALVFELAFLFLLFLPRVRFPAAVCGFLFHVMNALLVNIKGFRTQMASYVIYVDWHWLLGWLGRRWWPEPLAVFYDGNCRLCRRTIALLRTFDWMERIDYLNALEESSQRRPEIVGLPVEDLMTDMHAATLDNRMRGYDAYVAIAWRVPAFWIALPFLYFPPIRIVGQKIYRVVADSRTCSIARPPAPASAEEMARYPWKVEVAVGIFLSFIIADAGAERRLNAWPIACYPLFSELAVHSARRISLEATGPDGGEMRYEFQDGTVLENQRWQWHLTKIRANADEAVRSRQWQKLWEVAVRRQPGLASATEVRVVARRFDAAPESWGQPAQEEKVIYRWNPAAP